MGHRYFVCILTNGRRTMLYTGVTDDLLRRISEHREHSIAGFTRRYNVDRLVFYEETSEVRAAMARKKQIKAGPRREKVALIDGMKPEWRDLFEDLI
jgi:putative endonuclease